MTAKEVLELIEAVKWPVTVLIIGFMIRHEMNKKG